MFVCGLANASDAVEILCVSFILPAAECDLNLASSDKGYLSACTFLGMMIGGYIWGSISDIFGRRLILVFALLFNVFFAVLCGLSQSFIALIIFRFFSGVGYVVYFFMKKQKVDFLLIPSERLVIIFILFYKCWWKYSYCMVIFY